MFEVQDVNTAFIVVFGEGIAEGVQMRMRVAVEVGYEDGAIYSGQIEVAFEFRVQ